ncbi:MAG: LPS O-antigen length regulator [Gammaproteobacteria bacterium]|nr:LPS O-antigen length regulator [Gammaproteobacteria bacterium]
MYKNTNTDQIDIMVLIAALYRMKWWLLLWCFFVTGVAVWYSLTLPNLYRSEAVMLPVSESSGKAGGIASQLGSLGSIAGINLGGSEKKSQTALQLMKSREFFHIFNKKHDITLSLMAALSWDPKTDKLSYDPEIYDIAKQQWVREAVGLRGATPSENEVFEQFMSRLGVFQEKQTGIVNVSFQFISPKLAQHWLTLYLKDINDVMRRTDLDEAVSAINYLEKKLLETQVSEVRDLLFSLIEEHNKTLTIANVRPDYVFKIIDSPHLPDVKSGPMRSLIVIAALLGSFIVFSVVVLFVLIFRKTKQSSAE